MNNMQHPMHDAQQAIQPTHVPTSKKSDNKKLVVILILLVVLLIAALSYTGYLLYEKQNVDPYAVASEELEQVVARVSKHILLPEDKAAELATVLDVDALKKEYPEFYKNAKNGDQLLFYTDRAILYDPEGDIILNVAPIIDPNALEQTSEDTTPEVDETTSDVDVTGVVEESVE